VYLSNRNGIWYAVGKIGGVLYRESTGYRGPSGSKGYRLAQRRMVEIEHAIRDGLHGWLIAPIPTVTAYWEDTYRPTYTVRKRAPERDDQVMAHALPSLGDLRLDEVKKSDCERYINERRRATHANPRRRTPGRIAEGTVQRERSFLHALFQQAVEDELIERNPWRHVERAEYEVRDRVLSEDEQRELMTRLSPTYQRFVLFILGTGLRLEECLGIFEPRDDDRARRRNPKHDVDVANRQVYVTGKWNKPRWVPLPEELVPIVQTQISEGWWSANQQRYREVLAEACRARAGAEARISRRGRPVEPRAERRALEHISPHTLRHTFGNRWLTGGGRIEELSRILGHASIAVTEKHYAHLLKEDLRAAGDRVDLRLGLPKDATKVIAFRAGSQK
jgi:site-specific recombinase XerD